MSHIDRTLRARGGVAIGCIDDLPALEARAVQSMRRWCDGPDSQSEMRDEFFAALGSRDGADALVALSDIFSICAEYGRRPLMRHGVDCRCLGADEACFANFIAAAGGGEREDALMLATLMMRADMAPVALARAQLFGLALRRVALIQNPDQTRACNRTLH